MKVLLSGGCKNGKTSLGQEIACRLSGNQARFYMATMIPYDEEDRRRVQHHIEDRAGMGFTTIESPIDLAKDMTTADGTYLIDSITAWLLNSYYPDGFDKEPDPNTEQRCLKELDRVLEKAEHIVFVTDDMYQEGVDYDDFTNDYVRTLAHLGCYLAAKCDLVLELSAGLIYTHKGRWPICDEI